MKYSALSLAWNALSGHARWKPAWRDPAPRGRYDVVICGGGGHGLATAHYLAKVHGITNVAVLEKGYIGSGNAGRNTTIIRSNYLLPESIPFYEWSMQLWEGLEQDLNFNTMVSQRGVLNLYHSDAQRDAYARRGNAMRLHGVDAELLDAAGVRKMLPYLDFENARFPIQGGLLQRRGGTARHDGVVWGYARAADMRGVDSIQNCEVKAIRRLDGRVEGVETSRGFIAAGKVALALAGLHGGGAGLTDRVLTEAGHGPLHWVRGQRDPDPDFPTVAFPNPEEPGALDAVLDLARSVDAGAALALDPDADRLAVAAPGPDGSWRAPTRDQVGALPPPPPLAPRAAAAPPHRVLAPPVTTVVSSRLVQRIGAAHGARVIETLTGFKWLSRPGAEHPAWTQVLLYEEALGYAVGADTRDKDGITAALVVADLVAGLAAAGRTVWDVLDDLAVRHGAHVTRNGTLPLRGPGREDRLAGLVDRLVASPPTTLGGRPVVRTDRPAADVLRLWDADDTRVAVRPSGTEPKLKHYCEAVVAVPPGGDPADARAEADRRLDAVVADLDALLT